MKILSMKAENFKRLRAVEITPKSAVVDVTGRNAQGKTSVLDAILAALGGEGEIQRKPIRAGEEQAVIRLDLGDVVVTRTFKAKEDGDFTTSLKVDATNGARFTSPQHLLDSLVGPLSFDPLAFTRLSAKEQADGLKRLVKGFDFAAADKADKDDYAKRTDLNREAKRLRSSYSSIVVPADAPAEAVDESALVAELEGAAKFNGELDKRKARRVEANNQIRAWRQDAGNFNEEADNLRIRIAELEEAANANRKAADDLQDKLNAAAPLPEAVDVSRVAQILNGARAANAAFAKSQERGELGAQAHRAETDAEALTRAMESRAKAKAEAIKAAKLPVEGLSFDADGLTLNGLPFEQASGAEQLRASIAIAAAQNSRLRVLRVKDGSLLDADGKRVLMQFAQANDWQIWIESVDASGKIGFVIEDGAVASAN
jgi:DNA repair exonuclease SbcCD ATPase subunit